MQQKQFTKLFAPPVAKKRYLSANNNNQQHIFANPCCRLFLTTWDCELVPLFSSLSCICWGNFPLKFLNSRSFLWVRLHGRMSSRNSLFCRTTTHWRHPLVRKFGECNRKQFKYLLSETFDGLLHVGLWVYGGFLKWWYPNMDGL